MPAEHIRPGNKLAYGYWCPICGMPCSMMGHKECEPNPKLVKELEELNKKK